MTVNLAASKITTRPKFSRKQVAIHNSAQSCWVIHEDKVYDVTGFLDDHPGGPEFILEYAGKSVTQRMQQDHSAAAFDILEDYIVGNLYTPQEEAMVASECSPRQDSAVLVSSPSTIDGASESDVCEPEVILRKRKVANIRSPEYEEIASEESVLLSKKDPNFLDLKRPLLMQMWRNNYSKAYYMEQVHIPRHTAGSAPIFGGPLEILTLTPWYVVPLFWVPFVLYCEYSAISLGIAPRMIPLLLAVGVFVWTFIEYGLHRFLFHIDRLLPDNRAALTVHFLLHGVHHFLPMDGMRLVLPPALFVVLATPFWAFFHLVLPAGLARGLLGGGFLGYVLYDCCHYYLHHGKVWSDYLTDLKRYHMDHHYKEFDLAYGITSKLWDYAFGTVPL